MTTGTIWAFPIELEKNPPQMYYAGDNYPPPPFLKKIKLDINTLQDM